MPDRGYQLNGWRREGSTRIRSTWFGIAVVEEFWENEDGRREWRRSPNLIHGQAHDFAREKAKERVA